ncbi:MAG: hypothetical protein R2692_08360 [Microbacterium sp.]
MTVSLPEVPRSGFTLPKESFLDAGLGLVQRIENRVSGIPPSRPGHAKTWKKPSRPSPILGSASGSPSATHRPLPTPRNTSPASVPARRDAGRPPAPAPAAPKSERVELTVEAVRLRTELGISGGAVTRTTAPFDSDGTVREAPHQRPSL